MAREAVCVVGQVHDIVLQGIKAMFGHEVGLTDILPCSWVWKWLIQLTPSLAWCELYLLMATLFRRYEIEIYETTPRDMAWTDHLLML